MTETRDVDNFVEIFSDTQGGHACKKSVATEISIPGTNFVFCVLDVSYANGKVGVITTLETRERKRYVNTISTPKEIIILKDHYMLDVSHIDPGPRTETEPINSHSCD